MRATAWLLLVPGLLAQPLLPKSKSAFPDVRGKIVSTVDAETVEAARVIRGAVKAYASDHHQRPPRSLWQLVYPASSDSRYLKALPAERITFSNRAVAKFDGKGGWLYSANDGALELNVSQKEAEESGTDYADKVTVKNLAVIRQALQLYRDDHRGWPPKTLKQLVIPASQNDPAYIPYLPKEEVKHSNKVYGRRNGRGGWYYDAHKGIVELNILKKR